VLVRNVDSRLVCFPRGIYFETILTSSRIPSGGISTFGPLIVQAFGYDKFHAILFNIPFGAVQMVATLGGAWLATTLKKKSPVLILLCIPPIIGIIILLIVEHTKEHRASLLVGYYLISFYPGISPLIYSWSGQNTGGDTKRKVTTGVLFVGASAGNIIGPHLFTQAEAPGYHRGLRSCLALFVAIIVIVLLAATWVKILNRKHAARREALGKSAEVVDLSMETGSKVRETGGALNAEDGGLGEKAFDDETDLKNEDFIYLY
jgi:dipeptide/tripeptide permease